MLAFMRVRLIVENYLNTDYRMSQVKIKYIVTGGPDMYLVIVCIEI